MDLESLWTTLDKRLLPALLDYRQRLPTLDVSEKPDKTLLSEADLAVQKLLVESILDAFPGSGFIAEEDAEPLPRQGDPVWIIDPIDGTSEFVNPSGREYCSVVCRLDDGTPSGPYVLAPELGIGGSPVRVRWAGQVSGQGADPIPLTDEFLTQEEPTFAATVSGDPACVQWFLHLLRPEAAGGG